MHSVCRCSLPVWRRSFLKKDTPVTYFCPALDPPLGGSGRKTTTLVRDHEYFIPTKFHQNPSSGSGEEVENVKVYGRRRTDGRTTDRALWQYLTWAFGSGELKTISGSVLTGLIPPPPPAATNSIFSKSRSKSRSRPLGQKYWYQQKGLVTWNRCV